MNTLVRKLRSLVCYTQTPSRLVPAVRRNVAQVRGRVSGRGCFSYHSPLGVRFVCFADNATSLRLFVHDYQELAEIQIARTWLRPGDSCVDVGANVGLLAVAFATAVGSEGRVLALEPSPVSYARLVDTVQLLQLQNVLPIACCASDFEGVTSFFVASSSAADAEEESMQVDGARSSEFRRSVVPCARLTSVCQQVEGFESPALLKVDVEGAEPLVLAGGRQLIDSASPPLVIVEIHRKALANYGFGPGDILSFFPPEKFELFFIPRSVSDQTSQRCHGRIYRLDNEQRLPIYSNMIAIPAMGHAAARTAAVRKAMATFTDFAL